MKVQSTKDPKQIKKTIKICIIALCVLVASGSGYLGFKIYQQISNFDIDNLTRFGCGYQQVCLTAKKCRNL